MIPTVTARRCRACEGTLDSILDLGALALSNFPAVGTEDAQGPRAPLDLCACAACQLVQLRHTVDPDALFKDHYWYRSSINETMQAELADVVEQGIARIDRFDYGDFVLDVGANDGTLLAAYRSHVRTRSVPRIAFEPAQNLQADLARHAEIRYAKYFPPSLAVQGRPVIPPFSYRGLYGRVKVLTSIAMFYDLDAPHTFVDAVHALLHPEGVWIVQFQDLHQMLRATAFDNICHEHVCYYSLASFERLIASHGLRVVDAEVRAINGGSYRLYIKHADQDLLLDETLAGGRYARVEALRHQEQGCQDWHTLERFAWRVGQVRAQITAALGHLATRGPIDVYGASTKFNTLAQYCGLDGTLIRQAWERSPEKVGRQTVTEIPIVSEATGRADPPAALLAGIWQFRESILTREAGYLAGGGTILFPLPVVDLVSTRREQA